MVFFLLIEWVARCNMKGIEQFQKLRQAQRFDQFGCDATSAKLQIAKCFKIDFR